MAFQTDSLAHPLLRLPTPPRGNSAEEKQIKDAVLRAGGGKDKVQRPACHSGESHSAAPSRIRVSGGETCVFKPAAGAAALLAGHLNVWSLSSLCEGVFCLAGALGAWEEPRLSLQGHILDSGVALPAEWERGG